MKALNTTSLIKKLVSYSFFDWDDEMKSNKLKLHIGMGSSFLQSVDMNLFYDSWGFESVENPYSSVVISRKKWIELENAFFNWLGRYENLFLSQEMIVTPYLTNNWFAFDWNCSEWDDSNYWMKSDYIAYENLLLSNGVINSRPAIREDYRGALITSFDEFKTIGKMSTKGLRLLFFINNEAVIRITEYLTIQFFPKDSYTMNIFRGKLGICNNDQVRLLE